MEKQSSKPKKYHDRYILKNTRTERIIRGKMWKFLLFLIYLLKVTLTSFIRLKDSSDTFATHALKLDKYNEVSNFLVI